MEKGEYRSILFNGVEMPVRVKTEGRYLYGIGNFNQPILIGYKNEKGQEEYLPNVEEILSN